MIFIQRANARTGFARALLIACAITLSGCGGSLYGILRDNPLCAAKCDHPSMYRDLGCGCACIEGKCGPGQSPDRENGCQCKINHSTPGVPSVPMTSFGAACACLDSNGYVNTHNIGCFDQSKIPKKGSVVTVVGPPPGAAANSVCLNVCGAKTDLRGVFRMKVDSDICLEGGVVAGYRQNISGMLVEETTRNDFFEQRQHELLAALALAHENNRSQTGIKGGDFNNIQPLPPSPNGAAFVIRDAGLSCSTECAANSALCTRMKLDADNSGYLRSVLSKLPSSSTHTIVSSAFIRHSLRASPQCHRGALRFAGKLVDNTGEQCVAPLYMDMPGIANFAISVAVPAKVVGEIAYLGQERRITFVSETQMVELQVLPKGAHEVIGGKIRFISATPDEIVMEAQNGCVALGLQ